MSGLATRRLGVLALDCACGARCAVQTASAGWRRRQWQQTLAPVSRRWYADPPLKVKNEPSQTTQGESKAPETSEDDVVAAAAHELENPDSQPIESAAEATSNTAVLEEIPAGAVLESEEEELTERITRGEGLSEPSIESAEAFAADADAPTAVGRDDSTGFWSYAAKGAEDDEYLKNNVTPLGQDELEQQREYREYVRLAAWELPLLSSKCCILLHCNTSFDDAHRRACEAIHTTNEEPASPVPLHLLFG